MIINLPLIVFFIAGVNANLIVDGDFESLSTGGQTYTSSWFNGQDPTFQFNIVLEGGNKVLEMDFFSYIICQNVTFATAGNHSFSFKAKKVLDDTEIITIDNGETFYTQNQLSLVLSEYTTWRQFSVGQHSLCFRNTNDSYALLLDDVVVQAAGIVLQAVYCVEEDYSGANRISISIEFEDPFQENYWLQYNLEEIVGVEIDESITPRDDIKLLENDQWGVKLQVILQDNLKQNSKFKFTITDNFIRNSNGVGISFTEIRRGNLPLVVYYSEYQAETLKRIGRISKMIGETVSTSSSAWSLIGATYLISNLFAFCHIITLYNYLDFKWELPQYKLILNQLLKTFLNAGDLNLIFDKVFNRSIPVPYDEKIEEKIRPSPKMNGMHEHGFSSHFIYNSWDEMFNVGLMLVKLTIVRCIFWLPFRAVRKCCREIGKKAAIYIFYEVLTGAPTIILPIGFMLSPQGNLGSLNIQSKLNFAIFVTYSFALFISPFLVLHYEFQYERQIYYRQKFIEKKRREERIKKKTQFEIRPPAFIPEKQERPASRNKVIEPESLQQIRLNPIKKPSEEEKLTRKPEINLSEISVKEEEVIPLKSIKFNPEQKKASIRFIDNSLFFFIPLMVGIASLTLFSLSTMLLMILRFVLLLKYREIFTCWEFIKEMSNKTIWLAFNLIFLIYWILESVEIQNPSSTFFHIFLKNLGLMQVVFIGLGIVAEALFVVIDFLIQIFKKIKECCIKTNKVTPQKKNQEVVDRVEGNKKTTKIIFDQNLEQLQPEVEKKSEKKSEKGIKKTLKMNFKYQEPKKMDLSRTNRKMSKCSQALEIESC